MASSNSAIERFRDKTITFANGSTGINIDIPSFAPRNYHHVIARGVSLPHQNVDGKLFLPPASARRDHQKLPLVIVVPGSLGVAPSHVAHAETLTNLGIAAFVLDSFGARRITSTVADQTQYSFAASACDVLAAWTVLSKHPEIDATRIGAQGHSRGGSAVLTAATRRFANAMLGRGRGLVAIFAAYPWCGHQFLDPDIGMTTARLVIGDADEWCSPMQVQGHAQALRIAGCGVSQRLVAGAHHSFDRDTAISNIANASVAPAAPTVYIANDGAFIHPTQAEPDPALTDRDLMIYAMKAGYGRTGAKIGSRDGDAMLFRADMLAFWQDAMSDPLTPSTVARGS